MPRTKAKRMGRPKGSKNKPKMTNGNMPMERMGRPKKVTCEMTTGTVALKDMLWDTLKQVQCGKISASEVREVFTQTTAVLDALSTS